MHIRTSSVATMLAITKHGVCGNLLYIGVVLVFREVTCMFVPAIVNGVV